MYAMKDSVTLEGFAFGRHMEEEVMGGSTVVPPDVYDKVFEDIRVWGGPLMASVIVQDMKRLPGGVTAGWLKERLIGEGLLADQAQAIIDQVMHPKPGPWAMDGLNQATQYTGPWTMQGTEDQREPAPERNVPSDVLFDEASWAPREGYAHQPQWAQNFNGFNDVILDPGQAAAQAGKDNGGINWPLTIGVSAAVMLGIYLISQ